MNDTAQPVVKEKLGTLPYVIGGASFIPLIGLIFGIVSIIWGAGTKKQGGKTLIAIGACGIGFTVLLYGALFYFGFQQRGGVYDDMRIKLAQTTINSLVPSIEFYKLQNGAYPETLEALRKSLPDESMVFTIDPSDMQSGAQPKNFFYELVDKDHYYLRAVGSDGQPFTADDIVPQVSAPDKTGLLLTKR